MALPGVTSGPLPRTADVVIIGAGVQGLATAYELARLGVGDVVVLDRSWPGGGASGRNGELIRSAFSSAEWRGLFDLSLRRWRELSAELDVNLLFSPSGYLVLAGTDAQWEACVRDQAGHRAAGLRCDLLDERDVTQLLPHINRRHVRGGILQQDGGFAHHDAVVWAYLRSAARLGVKIYSDVEVTGIEIADGRVRGVATDRGRIAAPQVVNAAGGNAVKVNRMANVELALVEARLEMIVTEPLAPFLPVAVAVLDMLGYGHQTVRGEFVGGTELRTVDETTSLNATWALLRDMSTKWTALFPLLAGARLLRHWAGTVSMTKDLAPVIGPVAGTEGFIVSEGWVYGFMGAPAAGLLLAEQIVTGRTPALLAPFSSQRLVDGRLITETSLVVASEGH